MASNSERVAAATGEESWDTKCPVCGVRADIRIHHVAAVPVNSSTLVGTREDALLTPEGEIDLRLCSACGFLFNCAFDEALAATGQQPEDSQAFSGTFMSYAVALAESWVCSGGLRGNTIVEIGAGRGDFSRLLLQAGAGHVVAMDPTLREERVGNDAGGGITWLAERFDSSTTLPESKAVVMRHVLEHIDDPLGLLSALRARIDRELDFTVMVEVPDVQRILDEGAFWDVYYEHCSYFSDASIARLFDEAGFTLTRTELVYGGQYLIVSAAPSLEVQRRRRHSDAVADQLAQLMDSTLSFRERVELEVQRWQGYVEEHAVRGDDVVLWGSGSKAAGFISHMGPRASAVSRVVDVNPHKQGMFMPGSGLAIISPDSLIDSPPAAVIVMNPMYEAEISLQLDEMGLAAEVTSL